MSTSFTRQVICNFKNNIHNGYDSWKVVDDVVMGGRSGGSFHISSNGYAVYEGHVSLENSGGFSSVQYQFKRMTLNKGNRLKLNLKGDGRPYQVRVKDDLNTYYSYTHIFRTTGEWQELIVPLNSMYPVYRGRKVDLPNFDQQSMEEITFLIANKQDENFKLLIESIEII